MTERKSRKSKFADTPGDGGMTAIERQLLMVDEDRHQIINDRDSTKIGRYLIQEKYGFQNADLEQ